MLLGILFSFYGVTNIMRASSVIRASGLLLLLMVMGVGALAFAPRASAAAIAGDCILSVPANPLTAQGLASVWTLSDGLSTCREGDPASAVFVQATIFDPATGKFAVYSPIVENFGGYPLIMPTAPSLRTGDVIGIWGGGDDTITHLTGPGSGSCVNGLNQGSPFGQVFFCGAKEFFAAVHAAHVVVPPLGMAQDGFPCPTIRDFEVVDQDQSDNVQTTYLISPNGNTAQNTAANRMYLTQQGITNTVQVNPSDNRVLTNGMDPALGCSPWLVPDLADSGNLVPSQALDELQAAAYQSNPAYVPLNDPMTLDNGVPSLAKTNLYRAGVDQPQAATTNDASTAVYCINILIKAPAKLLLDEPLFITKPSPVPAIGNNLFTFLAARLKTTLGPAAGGGLGCTDALHITNPVSTTQNTAGVTEFAQIIPPMQGQQLLLLAQKPPVPVHAPAGEGFAVDPIYIILALMVVVLAALAAVGFYMHKMLNKLTSIDVTLQQQSGLMKLNATPPAIPKVSLAEQTVRQLQSLDASDPMAMSQQLEQAVHALQAQYGGTVAVPRPQIPLGKGGAGSYQEPYYG